MPHSYITDALAALFIPGGFSHRSLNYLPGPHAQHMCYTSACTFFSPLYASIWLKFWPSWVAWLLYLCPTCSLIWLGHKGSTSEIVTARSAGCVPQTGWSRKLAFLREYSVGEQKMTFTYCNTCPQMFFPAFPLAVRTCTLGHAYPGKGTLNGTILPGRCFLLSM